ncbi:MAG: UDP-glucose 4-epimerase GalE [Crocinitomicaceae bacterium]|nr:UDP-glucose 4-epimerase GalE [Crocinitomicaceae bacterium]
MDKKTILVTGGAGYIGSHTIVELVQKGFHPIIIDDFRNANQTVIAGLTDILGFCPTIYQVDVCNASALEPIFNNHTIHGIIHFAAYKAVGESVVDPLKYYRNNLQGLVTICELALKYQVNNFVFSSSCTVYGEPDGLKEVDEVTRLSKANSPYGNTKLIGEQILVDVQAQNPQFKCINLRYFNPIGAHPSANIGEFPIGTPSNLLPYITQTAIGKREKLTVFGNDYPTPDGTCIRDYIHVSDLANAHVAALNLLGNTENPLFEAINIGTGKGTSVKEIVDLFEANTHQKLNWEIGERRPGDVVEIFANAKKANDLLNWKANFTVEDAIIHAWNWEKKLAGND